MKKRSASIGIVGLLVISGLIGLANFGSDDAQGTPVSGSITKDTTWDLAGSPYIVVGNISVPSGITLTIEPGVEVKFDGFYKLDVEGTLIAIGSEPDRISITSNMATPMPGDWDCIRIIGHGEIEYCDISYGSTAIHLSSDNNITNNNIYQNEWCGIAVVGFEVANNNISCNNISNNQLTGLFLNLSSNNNITNNDFFSNYKHGICIGTAWNNIITGNNLINNGKGIHISYGSEDNKVYHNNFIDNINKQAGDTTNNVNQWDNGYPSGGNYWSDFDELSEGAYDEYKGPNQDVQGSDGKVDLGPPAGGKNPYMIDSDSQDNYPLMAPFGGSQPSPSPPSNLIARLSPGSPSNIELMWDASSDGGSGYDIVEGYTVYKSVTGMNGAYEFAAWIPANGSVSYVWADFGSGDGDWNDYFYIVRANNTSNNEEQNANKVGKFVNYLEEGWNLVSIPMIQVNTSRESALQTIAGNYTTVMGYHAGKSRPWLHWHRDKPNCFNDEIEIDQLGGYYIDMVNPDHLVIVGKVPINTQISLRAGWNLVSYPSLTSRTVDDALSSISDTYNRVYFFNVTSDRDEALESIDLMHPGYGYWIHVTKECVCEVSP